MENTVKKDQMEMVEQIHKKSTKKELAQAAMSGFFAGIQSREALTPEKSA